MAVRIDNMLRDLIDRAWSQYEAFRGRHTRGSCPILLFGDIGKYFDSDTKIITVGLNPSFWEFEDSPPHVQFDGDPSDYSLYLDTLIKYFANNPYHSWFDRGYERMLNGLSASYYGGQPRTALHTDICCTLATKPTWTKLSSEHKRFSEELRHDGEALWRSLVNYLEPDLILISIRRQLVEQEIAPLVVWRTAYNLRRKNPYRIFEYRFGTVRVVFGAAANVPFGTISYEAKEKIGRHLKERYRL